MSYYGEFAALFTAVCWTVSSLAFESAGKRVGSISLNIIRLCMAFVLISLFNLFSRGMILAVDADFYTWFWLSVSGLVGFVLGDLFLFKAFILVSARITMLIMSLAPPIAAIIGWFLLGEVLTTKQILGMTITIVGIAVVLIYKNTGLKSIFAQVKKKKMSIALSGILFAFLGTVGQAAGLVLSKKGMGDFDAFAATQIRIIAGIFGFAFIITVLKRWKSVISALHCVPAIKSMSLGSFSGPFMGVSFSLIAVKYTETGIAATLMGIVPVLIIIPSVLINKEKIKVMEIVGAVIAVIGVGFFFL